MCSTVIEGREELREREREWFVCTYLHRLEERNITYSHELLVDLLLRSCRAVNCRCLNWCRRAKRMEASTSPLLRV